MGEVYRAKDTRLKREVALKVLPDSVSADPDRMARFQREAEVLASLNHPNIAHVYGVEDGALAMELVEGVTLPTRLPIGTALIYARQIAEALEYAHERGVIHRDLKPANIKVTPDSMVKLLDFGLAKAIENPDSSATLTLGATRAGLILGTPAYMSPEQASGMTADRRADIWSFGAVLYEMLTGKLDPDWDALPSETPTSVRRLIQRCLTRDRKQRLQAIGEARIALDEAMSGATQQTAEPDPASAARRIVPWAVAGVLATALAIMAWGWWRASRPVDQPLVRLDADLGAEISLPPMDSNSPTMSSVSISPDGTRLAYVASVSGSPPKLFTRRLDQPKATELPGTEGARFSFFSPDGQWLGFAALERLSKISVDGGAVVPLVDIVALGASWGDDGSIVLDHLAGSGLLRIPSSGGAPTPLTEIKSGELAHAFPEILPGGKAALFTVSRGALGVDQASVEVVSLPDRRRKTLLRGGVSPHYATAPDGAGYLLYSNRGTLFAIPFDLKRLETRGTAVPVLDGVGHERLGGAAHFDVSRTGTLVYRKVGGPARTLSTVQWLDAAGQKEPLLARPGMYGGASLSPDGKRLALTVAEGSKRDVWVYNPQRDTMTRLTFGDGSFSDPVWSPDGRYIVFTSDKGGMLWTRADGAGGPQPLTQTRDARQFASSFSQDGKRLAYYGQNTDPGAGSPGFWIWTMSIEDSGGQLRAGKPEPFLKTQFNDCCAVFSPDGRWLAYVSYESGKAEVYVRAFPMAGHGGRWQISNSGGDVPMWSRKDRELLYQSGDKIMSVSYAAQGEVFLPAKPRVWAAKLGGATDFDLAPDGRRFAAVFPVGTPGVSKAEHEVTFVFNFWGELKRK
jgi:serine/threonine-protein kinase